MQGLEISRRFVGILRNGRKKKEKFLGFGSQVVTLLKYLFDDSVMVVNVKNWGLKIANPDEMKKKKK